MSRQPFDTKMLVVSLCGVLGAQRVVSMGIAQQTSVDVQLMTRSVINLGRILVERGVVELPPPEGLEQEMRDELRGRAGGALDEISQFLVDTTVSEIRGLYQLRAPCSAVSEEKWRDDAMVLIAVGTSSLLLADWITWRETAKDRASGPDLLMAELVLAPFFSLLTQWFATLTQDTKRYALGATMAQLRFRTPEAMRVAIPRHSAAATLFMRTTEEAERAYEAALDEHERERRATQNAPTTSSVH